MFKLPTGKQEFRNRGTRNKANKQKLNKMADLNPTIKNYLKYSWFEYSNLMTAIDRVNSKHDPSACCLQQTHLKHNDISRLNAKPWIKISYENVNIKISGVTILISHKLDSRTTTTTTTNSKIEEEHHL